MKINNLTNACDISHKGFSLSGGYQDQIIDALSMTDRDVVWKDLTFLLKKTEIEELFKFESIMLELHRLIRYLVDDEKTDVRDFFVILYETLLSKSDKGDFLADILGYIEHNHLDIFKKFEALDSKTSEKLKEISNFLKKINIKTCFLNYEFRSQEMLSKMGLDEEIDGDNICFSPQMDLPFDNFLDIFAFIIELSSNYSKFNVIIKTVLNDGKYYSFSYNVEGSKVLSLDSAIRLNVLKDSNFHIKKNDPRADYNRLEQGIQSAIKNHPIIREISFKLKDKELNKGKYSVKEEDLLTKAFFNRMYQVRLSDWQYIKPLVESSFNFFKKVYQTIKFKKIENGTSSEDLKEIFGELDSEGIIDIEFLKRNIEFFEKLYFSVPVGEEKTPLLVDWMIVVYSMIIGLFNYPGKCLIISDDSDIKIIYDLFLKYVLPNFILNKYIFTYITESCIEEGKQKRKYGRNYHNNHIMGIRFLFPDTIENNKNYLKINLGENGVEILDTQGAIWDLLVVNSIEKGEIKGLIEKNYEIIDCEIDIVATANKDVYEIKWKKDGCIHDFLPDDPTCAGIKYNEKLKRLVIFKFKDYFSKREGCFDKHKKIFRSIENFPSSIKLFENKIKRIGLANGLGRLEKKEYFNFIERKVEDINDAYRENEGKDSLIELGYQFIPRKKQLLVINVNRIMFGALKGHKYSEMILYNLLTLSFLSNSPIQSLLSNKIVVEGLELLEKLKASIEDVPELKNRLMRALGVHVPKISSKERSIRTNKKKQSKKSQRKNRKKKKK